jgi:hypothetical protein
LVSDEALKFLRRQRRDHSEFEIARDRRPTAPDVEAIQRALEEAGVEFTNGKRPGVRLKKDRK